jgi:hypothetical protein
MGEERERTKPAHEEPDVEGHRVKAYAEDSEPPEKEKRESEESEGPDVEGHRFKA